MQRQLDDLYVFGSGTLGTFTSFVLDDLTLAEILEGDPLDSRVVKEHVVRLGFDETENGNCVLKPAQKHGSPFCPTYACSWMKYP